VSKVNEKPDARSSNPTPATLPDRSPPDQVTELIKEYPGLVVAAGLGLGLLVGALLPRSPGRKLMRGSAVLATALGEIGYSIGKQALTKASDAASEGRERLGDLRDGIGERASDAAELAGAAGRRTADAGKAAGDNIQQLAIDASTVVREIGEELARRASKTLARLRD
jgi:ElaB/YqjD/DUF883 family membrane-anchored ribosome-binding protein